MAMKNVARAMELPGLCLAEARRIWGDKAEVMYGERYATAGLEVGDRGMKSADEVTVCCDDALERMLLVLKSLSGAKP